MVACCRSRSLPCRPQPRRRCPHSRSSRPCPRCRARSRLRSLRRPCTLTAHRDTVPARALHENFDVHVDVDVYSRVDLRIGIAASSPLPDNSQCDHTHGDERRGASRRRRPGSAPRNFAADEAGDTARARCCAILAHDADASVRRTAAWGLNELQRRQGRRCVDSARYSSDPMAGARDVGVGSRRISSGDNVSSALADGLRDKNARFARSPPGESARRRLRKRSRRSRKCALGLERRGARDGDLGDRRVGRQVRAADRRQRADRQLTAGSRRCGLGAG